ncbi:MAG: DUF2946 family protein [Caldimonas sp.]
MRRYLVVFLLTLMSLQTVWGAVAPYCGHETSAKAKKHWGHHEHQHQSDAQTVDSADDAGDASTASHADCAVCHFGTLAPLLMPYIAVCPAPREPLEKTLAPSYRSHIPPGLERPDRADATVAARFGGDVVLGSLQST